MFDWTPTIRALGLEKFMSTVPGIELTGSGAHFNAFPLTIDPAQVNGDPMGNGWFFKMKIGDAGELDGLMDETAYKEFTASLE